MYSAVPYLTYENYPVPHDVSTFKLKFFCFSQKNYAENFLNFLKTDFVRFCLSIYKNNSQLDRGELEIIPWLDFTKEWNDKNLYEYFSLTKEEVDFIEKNIPKYY